MDRQTMEALIAEMESGTQNFRGFDSSMSFDDQDSVLAMTGDPERYGLSTYEFRIEYLSAGPNQPVTVQLFATDFNTGTFVGNNLVFTNGGGDTATIIGVTSSFLAFMNMLRYNPFTIKFVRLTPVAQAQLNNPITFREDSVWGGFRGNSLTPRQYVTPEQFQLGQADVPMNYNVDSGKGMFQVINNTEIAASGGYVWTLWVSGLVKPSLELKGKPPRMIMNKAGIQDVGPAQSMQSQINVLAKYLVQQQQNKNPFLPGGSR